MVMVKRGNSFERVRAGLHASRDGMLEERERLRTISEAILMLPEVVRPWAQKLMFDTKMTAEEIIAAARHVPGGQGPSGDAQLATKGRETAAILLGKAPDPDISFDPVAPNIRTFDLEGPLGKAGAALANALKKAGYLGSALSGPGRMA
jgi:hypothetical protein